MIVGILFLCLQTILIFVKPKYFLFTYLLFISSFLGFLPKIIEVNGFEIGLFYQNILMLINFFIYIKYLNKYKNYVKYLLFVVLILYCYGVLYPFANGSSTILQSIISSKEFSSLFLIHYLFIHRKSYTYEYIYKVISFFGYYFLIILGISVIINYIPPQYIKRPGQIEYYYPTFLSLFLFIKMAQANKTHKKIIATLFLIVWGTGMYYEGHAAITLTTLMGCIIILFRIPVIKFLINYKSLIIGLGILGLILILPVTQNYISEFFQNPALLSRLYINKNRIELIKKEPLQGYGFLDRRALEFENPNRYGKSLSFIDSGYVDLLGKFGIIGTILYLSTLIIMVFRQTGDILITSLKVFFLQYFAVNITWSVFSYSLGTIALALTIFISFIYSEMEINANKIKRKNSIQTRKLELVAKT